MPVLKGSTRVLGSTLFVPLIERPAFKLLVLPIHAPTGRKEARGKESSGTPRKGNQYRCGESLFFHPFLHDRSLESSVELEQRKCVCSRVGHYSNKFF